MSAEEKQIPMNALQRLVVASRLAFKVARGNIVKGDPVFPRGQFGSLWSGPGFIGSFAQALSFGGFRGSSINYADEVGELSSSSLCMAVWNYIGTALCEAPPIVTAFKEGETSGEVIPEHPLVKILNQPNEFCDGASLLQAFALDWLFSGDSYWIIVSDPKYLTPTELWYVPYFMMQPLADERNRRIFIKEYQYIVDGYRYSYAPEEIVHIKRGINPRDLRHGIGVFDSVLREIYTDNQAANFSAVILKNWGIVPFVLSPPKNAKSDAAVKAFGDDPNKAREQAMRIKATFMEATTGDRRGEPIVNTIPLEITKLGFGPQELDISALRKVPESRVAAVTGLPAALLQFLVGLEFGTSYASYKEAREQAYESVVSPLLKIIARNINKQLLPKFGDPEGRRLEMSFDLSGVRVLQEDQDKVFTRANIAVQGGWGMVSDARAMVGWKVEEADKIYLRGGKAIKEGEEMLPPELPPTPEQRLLPPAPAGSENGDRAEVDKLLQAALTKWLISENGGNGNGNGHKKQEIIVEGELIEEKGGQGSGYHGHAGRPGLIGGSAPSTAAITKPDQTTDILTYLERVSEIKGDPPQGFKYNGLEQLVLKEGESFTQAPLPKGVDDEKLGLCYMNAYHAAEFNDHLDYVEGYAINEKIGFPMAHAWAATKDGKVVDPTWDRFRRKGEAIGYFGVRIPMQTVRKTILAREKYGVLHDPEQGFPLLRTGIEHKGGEGSGFFGHAGRPGEVGGSLPEGAGATHASDPIQLDSQSIYRRADGTYPPERAALHKKWIEDDLAVGVKRDEGVIYFLGGGPAAGKTSSIISRLESEGALDGVPRIDPDEYKYRNPDFIRLKNDGDRNAANFVHEEASEVSKIAVNEGQQRGFNLLLDTTGDNSIDNLEKKIRSLRSNGAKVINAEYAFISDPKAALPRAEERAQKTGRYVIPSLALKTHRSVAQVFPEAIARGLFDTAKLWNTDERTPRLVATYDKTGGLKILDFNLWDAFQAVGK